MTHLVDKLRAKEKELLEDALLRIEFIKDTPEFIAEFIALLNSPLGCVYNEVIQLRIVNQRLIYEHHLDRLLAEVPSRQGQLLEEMLKSITDDNKHTAILDD